jgi:hypothetical protein
MANSKVLFQVVTCCRHSGLSTYCCDCLLFYIVSLEQAKKAQTWSRVIALLFL